MSEYLNHDLFLPKLYLEEVENTSDIEFEKDNVSDFTPDERTIESRHNQDLENLIVSSLSYHHFTENEVKINSIDASVSRIEERISSNDIQAVTPQEIPISDNANRLPKNHQRLGSIDDKYVNH